DPARGARRFLARRAEGLRARARRMRLARVPAPPRHAEGTRGPARAQLPRGGLRAEPAPLAVRDEWRREACRGGRQREREQRRCAARAPGRGRDPTLGCDRGRGAARRAPRGAARRRAPQRAAAAARRVSAGTASFAARRRHGGFPRRALLRRALARAAAGARPAALMLAPEVAFVDLETTGTVPSGDRVTEIGIVRVSGGELVDEWSSLVDPGRPIPEDIQVLTGITNAMVRGAPGFHDVAREVRERLAGRLFVAHNARFDYGFLKNEFRRLGMRFTADVLCTVRLSRRLYPEAPGHGLDAVVARHGLREPHSGGASNDAAPGSALRTGRHSALGDARAIWRFVQAIYRERSADEIEAAVRRLLRIPSLPPQLAPDALEGLPEGPGV